jgi:hypothetical protein
MAQVTIKFQADVSADPCGLCGQPTVPPAGPALFLEPGSVRICRGCGRKHAPSLVALLDLAEVAQRVGRIARHTLVPSLETLLDLARAAENYTYVTSEPPREVA